MLIDLIIPLVESDGYEGGIKDFGAFVEGYCFKVKTAEFILREIPKTFENLETWMFCVDNPVNIYLMKR